MNLSSPNLSALIDEEDFISLLLTKRIILHTEQIKEIQAAMKMILFIKGNHQQKQKVHDTLLANFVVREVDKAHLLHPVSLDLKKTTLEELKQPI